MIRLTSLDIHKSLMLFISPFSETCHGGSVINAGKPNQ